MPFSAIAGRIAGYDDDASRDALEKRFDRDKAALRGLGVPLEYVEEDEFGRSGYRVARERFFLREIQFTVEEGIVLAALERALGRGDALGDDLRSALAKVGVDSPLSEAFRESVGEMQVLDPRVSADRAEESRRLAALGEALAALRPVRFAYYTLGTGELKERVVEPYGLGYAEGHWYLVGRDTAVGEERVFRTSRIQGKVQLLAASGYAIPEGFRLRDRIGLAPWELRAGERREVRIRFGPDVAWMIAENLRPGQSFTSVPDGSVVLALSASDPRALAEWVAGFGPDAEILDPPEYRDALCAHLAGLLARYGP